MTPCPHCHGESLHSWTYDPSLFHLAGQDHHATILLSWLRSRADGAGRVTASAAEIQRETHLSKWKQDTARERLVNQGWIEDAEPRKFKPLEFALTAAFFAAVQTGEGGK